MTAEPNDRREPDEPTPLPESWIEGTVASNGIDAHYTRTGGERGSRSRPPAIPG